MIILVFTANLSKDQLFENEDENNEASTADHVQVIHWRRVKIVVVNDTFNNISVISCRSVYNGGNRYTMRKLQTSSKYHSVCQVQIIVE